MRSLIFPYKVLVLRGHSSLTKTDRWVPYLQIHVCLWRKTCVSSNTSFILQYFSLVPVVATAAFNVSVGLPLKQVGYNMGYVWVQKCGLCAWACVLWVRVWVFACENFSYQSAYVSVYNSRWVLSLEIHGYVSNQLEHCFLSSPPIVLVILCH